MFKVKDVTLRGTGHPPWPPAPPAPPPMQPMLVGSMAGSLDLANGDEVSLHGEATVSGDVLQLTAGAAGQGSGKVGWALLSPQVDSFSLSFSWRPFSHLSPATQHPLL